MWLVDTVLIPVGPKNCWNLFNKETRAAALGEVEGGLGWRRAGRLLPQSRQGMKRRRNLGVAARWHGRVRSKGISRKNSENLK